VLITILRLHSYSAVKLLRLHSEPPAIMEIHIQDPTVSRLHKPNVSFTFSYMQSVHGITVTILLITQPTFLVTKYYTVFQKKTSTHIVGYKLRNSCLILIIFDIKIPHIV